MRCCASRSVHLGTAVPRIRWHNIPCRAEPNNKPSNSAEVLQWVAHEFKREVAWSKPEAHVHLAKACLLIALEEEAATELNQDLPYSGSIASSSTWNLERLDALAAEVSAHFRHAVAPGLLAVTGRKDSFLSRVQLHEKASSASDSDNADGRSSTSSSSGQAAAPQLNFASDELPPTSDPAVWAEMAGRLPINHIPHRSAEGAAAGVPGGQQGSAEAAQQREIEQLVASLSEPQLHALMQQYPVQALSAVNTVMFDRHGYKAGNRYGITYYAQLSAVMEYGFGNPAALSILYMEVCARLGLPMNARPVEDGRYTLVWPAQVPLTVGGLQFVVDPYGGGCFMAAEEACELFGLALPQLLQPASRRQLLASLLVDLRDCHWARAAGCSAKPAFMTPLDMDTALGDRVAVRAGSYSISRALAAAEKRLLLLPDDRDARLEFALLLYMNKQYDDAWLELGILQEEQLVQEATGVQQGQQQPEENTSWSSNSGEDKLAILTEKVRLLCSSLS